MGYEYHIETYDLSEVALQPVLTRLPFFAGRAGNRYFYDQTAKEASQPHDFEVHLEADHLYILHQGSRDVAGLLLGILVQQLASSNDHVVVSEI